MRYGMLIELDKCVGCQACVSACKQRWGSGPGAARDWVREYEHGTRGKDLGVTFYPGLCNHCAEHPCTTDCPTGATFMNADGIVVVDESLCIGCGNCVSTCPYGARHVDNEKKIVEKCNLCDPYVRRGEQPACVATCLAECRHFGDLDSPNGALSQRIRAKDAKPLTTTAVNVGSKLYYAGIEHRARILEQGVVRAPERSQLTRIWDGYTRPLARVGVPAAVALAGAGGLLLNLRARADAVALGEAGARATKAAETAALPDELPRHRFGMRFIHWFNALSWVLLVVTGTALMVGPAFALFGAAAPRLLARTVGGASRLLRFHVLWGLLWAFVIVPTFLYLKHGGLEAVREILVTRDDIRWLLAKPLVAMGLGNGPLPPQDKYNAGQKVFALTALGGTSLIIATGLVMTFHLGSASVIAAAVLVHKLAIALALAGVSVHITMAAIVREERPALKSMLRGTVDRHHAEAHSAKWVEEFDKENASNDGSRPGGACDVQ